MSVYFIGHVNDISPERYTYAIPSNPFEYKMNGNLNGEKYVHLKSNGNRNVCTQHENCFLCRTVEPSSTIRKIYNAIQHLVELLS